MKRNDILGLVKRERGFRYGGREVLRAVCDMPCGSCTAALHFARIMTYWEELVESTLFPAAAAEWEAAAGRGQGYAFKMHIARGKIRTESHKKGLRIEFSATLSTGGELRRTHVLSTLWDAAGERQRKTHRFSKKQPQNPIAK